ncbi:KDM1B, partial [Symbiodinium microadriaticum]
RASPTGNSAEFPKSGDGRSWASATEKSQRSAEREDFPSRRPRSPEPSANDPVSQEILDALQHYEPPRLGVAAGEGDAQASVRPTSPLPPADLEHEGQQLSGQLPRYALLAADAPGLHGADFEMGGMRQPISIYCCAKFTVAAVITLLCMLGTVFWASHDGSENARPPSFLQMTSSRMRSWGKHERRKAVGSLSGKEDQCPAELLSRHGDCRVVKVRQTWQLGKSIRMRKDTVIVWSAVDPELASVKDSIIGFKPAMVDVKSRCPGESESNMQVNLVHHINLYAYDAAMPLTIGQPYVFDGASNPVLPPKLEEQSMRMLASHDKEAGDYFLPSGYGIPFGKQVLMERHFLFPKCWNYDEDVAESSGMDLYVTSSHSLKPAALIGAVNFNMNILPKQGPVEWVTRISAEKLKGLVSGGGNDWPEILAVHLHTHDVASGKFFEILNKDGSVAFRSDKEKAGYGLQEQSFANLPEKGWPRLRVQAGQQFLQHCLFESNHLQKPVVYGLGWGEEMCAPLLVVGGVPTGTFPMSLRVLCFFLAPIATSSAACEEGRIFVVGSGIAGLVAASSLRRFGCNVTVLEALDRLGGRTHTLHTGVFAGREEGAHWVHGGIDNVPVSTLLDMHKVGQVRVGGDDDYEGSRSRLLMLSSSNVPLTAAERDVSFDLFESARAASEAFASDKLSEKDLGTSVADVWRRALEVNYSSYGRALLDWHQKVSYEQDSGASIQELSALAEYVEDYSDFYSNRSDGWEMHGDGFVQGGYSTLVQRLAAGLEVHLQSPVSRIEYSNDSVAITVNEQTLRGTAVILTASVGALQAENIAFEPALPSWKHAALKRLGMGNVAKVLVKLSKAVPILHGVYSLGRLAEGERKHQLLSYCICDEMEASRSPILECFLGGQQAITAEMMDAEELNRQVASELHAALGADVEEVMITKWSSNPYIKGAWSYARVNSSVEDFDALARSIGKLHFAGEGTCRLLYGNVHAAVVSGARAAHQLLKLERREEDSWPLFRRDILQLCATSGARQRAVPKSVQRLPLSQRPPRLASPLLLLGNDKSAEDPAVDWVNSQRSGALAAGPMPTILSSIDGYASRITGLWEDVVRDIKRLLSELRSEGGRKGIRMAWSADAALWLKRGIGPLKLGFRIQWYATNNAGCLQAVATKRKHRKSKRALAAAEATGTFKAYIDISANDAGRFSRASGPTQRESGGRTRARREQAIKIYKNWHSYQNQHGNENKTCEQSVNDVLLAGREYVWAAQHPDISALSREAKGQSTLHDVATAAVIRPRRLEVKRRSIFESGLKLHAGHVEVVRLLLAHGADPDVLWTADGQRFQDVPRPWEGTGAESPWKRAAVDGRAWLQADHLLGRVREVQNRRAIVQLYWRSPQGLRELSPMQGFIDLQAGVQEAGGNDEAGGWRRPLRVGQDVSVHVSPLAAHLEGDELPLKLSPEAKLPRRPSLRRALEKAASSPKRGASERLPKKERHSSVYWGAAKALPFLLAGRVGRHLRGKVQELRGRSAVVQIFWEVSPVPGLEEPQLGPVKGKVCLKDLMATYGISRHQRPPPKCADFLHEGQLVSVEVADMPSDQSLNFVLSMQQPVMPSSVPTPPGRVPLEWRDFLDTHGLVVEFANLRLPPAEALEVFQRELGGMRTLATETIAATIWELTQRGQDIVVTGAIPAAERLFLQTRLALRHLAALPRTPPGLPDVLFLCSGSIARRFRKASEDGFRDEGPIHQTLAGTTHWVLERARNNPELLSRISLFIVDGACPMQELLELLNFMPRGRRWGPTYLFHRETLPAKNTAAETALVDAPARLQLANGVRGAHISMRIVNADNAKEAAALIAQLHTRQSILVFTSEISVLQDELRRVVAAQALASERLCIVHSTERWRASASFDIILHVSPPPTTAEYLRRLASCKKEAISLVAASLDDPPTWSHVWAKHVSDFATGLQMAKLREDLAELSRPPDNNETEIEAPRVAEVELSNSFQKDYMVQGDEELVWRAGEATDLDEVFELRNDSSTLRHRGGSAWLLPEQSSPVTRVILDTTSTSFTSYIGNSSLH